MQEPLYFLNPNDPEWDKAWAAFPDPEMENAEYGEVLQYMASYHQPTGYVHEFRHRAMPGTHQRQVFYIPCTPGWQPRELAMQQHLER